MVDRVARIRIELRHTKPKIWRRVDVPLSYTLISLHRVIQAAFGWHGGHLFEFSIGGREFSELATSRFGSDPFEWDPEDAAKIKLHTIVDWGFKRFDYRYDFGDDCQHIIAILRVLDADTAIEYPALVADAHCAPVNDIGGVWGFDNLAKAARDPNHPDRKEYEEWPGSGSWTTSIWNTLTTKRCGVASQVLGNALDDLRPQVGTIAGTRELIPGTPPE
jgi:hypothetical protein